MDCNLCIWVYYQRIFWVSIVSVFSISLDLSNFMLILNEIVLLLKKKKMAEPVHEQWFMWMSIIQ